MKRITLLVSLFLCSLVWAQAGGLAELTIGQHKLLVELAVAPEEQSTGLMNRESLPSDHGMLFIFARAKKATFWMHNTSVPLDLAFLDEAGLILEIHPLVPFNESIVESKSDQVRYALEVNRDWFASRNLKTGLKVQGLPK